MDNKMAPEGLVELRRRYTGFIAARVIITATNLGIFENLKKASPAREVAAKLKTDFRATEILLDALAGIGLVSKSKDSRYKNTPLSNRYLVKSSRLYQGDIVKHASSMWENFSALDEVLRTGRPAKRGFKGPDHESFIMGMHNLTVLRSKSLLNAIGLRNVKTMLDLGGGPGTNAIEMARRGVKAAIFDLPETIRIARKVVRREGIKEMRFIAGDFQSDNIGSGYDVILVSQIFHAFSAAENISLLHKCAQALNRGGRVAIQEFPINDSHTVPSQSALFSVNMLVGTAKGRCYSPKEIKHWLTETGFGKCTVKNLPETVLIIGQLKA